MDIFENFAVASLIKLFVATALGAMVGLEREIHGRPAGLRTNALVALAACLLIVVSRTGALIGLDRSADFILAVDPARMAAGIVTGIGFLGAGAILRVKENFIRGLTTAAGIWFVAAIGIANTMVMAIYERTKEIGILKAVGASPRDIRVLFMAEAAVIGLLGGIMGTIGGWLLGIGLNKGILAYLEWKELPVTGTFFVVTGWLVALALVFAIVVGLLAGLYPAARAARLDPLEALRHE